MAAIIGLHCNMYFLEMTEWNLIRGECDSTSNANFLLFSVNSCYNMLICFLCICTTIKDNKVL